MKTRMQRRMLASASVAVVAALALTGCSGSSDGPSMELTDEDVSLSMTWWGADSRTQQTNEALDLFMEEYPNITVTGQFSDWTGYWDRLATSTAGGDMPDVAQFDQLYLASYADRGTLLDLSEFPEILDTSAIPTELLDAGVFDDAQYAVPVGGTPNGVIINTAIFDEYGIPLPDTSTWTWDDLSETAQAITEASDGDVHGVIPFGSDSFSLTVWARQRGETLFDENGDVSISPETLAAYWERGMELIEDGAAPPVADLAEQATVSLDQSALALGQTAMGFIPAGQMTAFQSASPNATFILADWPTDADTAEGYQYLKPSMYWTASARSDHPAEAALLINFLGNDERVAKLFGTDRGVPATPAFQEAIAPDLDESGRITLDFTTAMTEESGDAAAITPNGASAIETTLGRYNQQVQFGEATASEAAEGFIAEMQSSIDGAR